MTGDLSVSYDAVRDVLTVEGVHYSGDLFRQFSIAPPGTFIQIIERRDGNVVLRDVRSFRAIHGRLPHVPQAEDSPDDPNDWRG